MKCLKLALLILLCLLTLVPFAFGDIYYNANTYPFTFPTYGTAMGFSTNMVFDTVYRESDYWYFNGYGFQVQNANLTITDFFTSDSNKLTFTVSAPSGTSTTKVYCGDKGNPTSITPVNADGGYDAAAKVQTLVWTHASDQEFMLSWHTPTMPGGAISHTLMVVVQKQTGVLATNMLVNVKIGNQTIAYKVTDAFGEAQFQLGTGTYLIEAGDESERGSTTVQLDSNKRVTIVLEPIQPFAAPADLWQKVKDNALLLSSAFIIVVAVLWLRKPRRRKR